MKKEIHSYIPREVYSKTEGLLYAYYKDKKEINNIDNEIRILEDNIKELEYDITHTRVSVNEEECYQVGTGVGEKIQSSMSCESHAERVIIRAIEKLERERADSIGRLNKLKGKKRKFKSRYSRLENNISTLSGELQDFLKYKYQDKLYQIQIAYKLHTSQPTVTRRRSEVIMNVAQFMHWI